MKKKGKGKKIRNGEEMEERQGVGDVSHRQKNSEDATYHEKNIFS
jgi:hypothetical protein